MHRHSHDLRHPEEASMPVNIKHFAQAVQLCSELWSSPDQIRIQFEHEGHRSSIITTIVAYRIYPCISRPFTA